MKREHIGYFTSPEQTSPVYSPPLDSPCPFCGAPVTAEAVRTINVMPEDHSTRASLFYYVHRHCHNAATDARRAAIDVEVMELFGAWTKRGST